MSKTANKEKNLYRRLRTQYRIVFINDESLEEVASFRLTIRKLYVLFSTLFVVIVALTITVLLLSPLKYYIPGYGSNKTHLQVIRMKENIDSLTDMVAAQQVYEANIRNVITGNVPTKLDTVKLNSKAIEKEEMKNIFPVQDEIKKKRNKH